MRADPPIRVHVTTPFLAGLCLFCFLDQWGLLLPLSLAITLHELGHLAALRACRVKIYGLSLGLGGAVIRAELPGGWKELICVLAGPAVNLVFWLLPLPGHGLFRLCHMGLLAYNVLPIDGLDGGRAAKLLCTALWHTRGLLMFRLLNVFTVTMLVSLGVLGTCRFHLGLLPGCMAGFFLLRMPNMPLSNDGLAGTINRIKHK